MHGLILCEMKWRRKLKVQEREKCVKIIAWRGKQNHNDENPQATGQNSRVKKWGGRVRDFVALSAIRMWNACIMRSDKLLWVTIKQFCGGKIMDKISTLAKFIKTIPDIFDEYQHVVLT